MLNRRNNSNNVMGGATKAIVIIKQAASRFGAAYNDLPEVKAKLAQKKEEFETGLERMQFSFSIGDHVTQAAFLGVRCPEGFDRHNKKMMQKLGKDIEKAQIQELQNYVDNYAKEFKTWLKENNIKDRGTLTRIYDGLRAALEK